MHSDVSLARLKQFPLLMWILLIGDFITRGSLYMVWPFLAVILYERFGISATEVGLILSSAALISVFIGFIGGALSDRFGRHQLMFASGIMYVASFCLLAEVDTVFGFVVVITSCSIAKAIWDPPTSALVGDIVPDSKTRELALQSRYFIVNVGAAIGPMVGVWFGLTGQQSSFYITAGAFAVLLVMLQLAFKYHGQIKTASVEAPTKFKQTLGILGQDKLLQCLILANVLCMLVYAQMDTSLIQYLTRADVPDLLALISSLILTNALVIISSQFLLLKMMAGLTLETRIQIGLVMLAVSQFWLAVNPLELFWGWIGAIALMSLAEAILFPTMNVHIDRLAPENLRGAYFGAASFYSLGYALAPFLGGVVLDWLGGFWLFAAGGLLCLVVIYLYAILPKMTRPDFEKLTRQVKELV